MIFCTIYLGPFVWYLPLSLQPPAVFVGSHSVAANATAIRVLLNILEEPHAQNLPCEVAHACTTPSAGVIGVRTVELVGAVEMLAKVIPTSAYQRQQAAVMREGDTTQSGQGRWRHKIMGKTGNCSCLSYIRPFISTRKSVNLKWMRAQQGGS